MALPLQQTPRSSQPKNLLAEIETQGTPLRIDGQTETYYVLSASQLNALVNQLSDELGNFEDATNFSPEDFDLTEADLSQYEMTQKMQQDLIQGRPLQPLSANLADRLTQHAQQPNSPQDNAEREELLRKLESAMLANLKAASISAQANRLKQHAQQPNSPQDNAEREELLHKLESAMLADLQATSISAQSKS